MRRAALVLALSMSMTGALGCKRARQAPQIAAAPEDLSLPDKLAGFTAMSAPATGPGWVRRRYKRAGARIDVTLARTAQPPGGYDAWVTMSRGYAQAALDPPAADANGFYQCTELPAPSCDLLIQLRSGVHLELRGNGSSTRADVDALAGALPLRALAVAP